MTVSLRTTPLADEHRRLGARMGPFAGFLMPMQYAGIVAEHEAVRTRAAVFDTCHMGQLLVRGPTALADLEMLVTCDLAALAPGQCRYGLLCNADGGVLDDLVVYRLAAQEFLLVVNAANQAADFAWLRRHIAGSTLVEDRSPTTAKIDLQGPWAPRIARTLVTAALYELRYYHFTETRYGEHAVLLSRTGYTGEIGYEVYGPPAAIRAFWRDCLAAGAVPAGLGARDTLRLEMGMPLYGHELTADRNAAEAGPVRALAPHKPFIGAAAVRDPARIRARLTGLVLEDRRAARQGDAVYAAEGRQVGTVTSGSYCPWLEKSLAMGYVPPAWAAIGTRLQLDVRGTALAADVVPLPFYKRPK